MNVLDPPPRPVASVARQNNRRKSTPPLPTAKPAPLSADVSEDQPGPGSGVSDKTQAIIARIDVGWGNTLYLRGTGGDLSWDVGVPMVCSGDDRWVWSCHADHAPKEFKFLINDQIWCLGENCVMAGADITVCNPVFPA